MPVTADQLRDLFALGLASETVLEVVSIFERDGDVTRDVTDSVTGDAGREARLEKARARQQKYRDKSKINARKPEANDAGLGDAETSKRDVTGSVTRDVTPENRCDLSSLLTESQSGIREVSKKDTTSVEEGRKARVSRGTRLSENSQLSDADRQFARSEGLTDERIDRAWAEFIDYWTGVPGQRGTKLTWSGTWRNRVRAISGKQGNQNGQRTGVGRADSSTGPRAGQDAIITGVGRAFARRFGNKPSDGGGAFQGCADAAGNPAAERGATGGDRRSPPQLELIVQADTGSPRGMGNSDSASGDKAFDGTWRG